MNTYTLNPVVNFCRYLLVFFVSYAIWLLLAGTLRADELITGALVSLVVTGMFTHRFTTFAGFRFSWLAPLYILIYLWHFLIALVRANFDLAWRVLSPSLPIRPAIVEIKTELESPLGKMLLANTITLTPGTLTIDVIGDRLLVHWVNSPPDADLEKATKEIATSLEKNIRRFLI